MAHIDLLPAGTSFGAAEAPASVRGLIQTSLRRAYPLPRTGQGDDERFGRLLEALAQRGGSEGQSAVPAQPPQVATLDDCALVTLLVGTALGGLAAVIGGAYGVSLALALLP